MSYFDEVIEPRLYRNPPVRQTSQRVRWMCKDGTMMFVDQMEDRHLNNAIKACERRIGTSHERHDDKGTLAILNTEKDKR